VANATTDGYNPVPVRWNGTGRVDTLQLLKPPLRGYAYAISDAGQVQDVGSSVAGRLTGRRVVDERRGEVLDTFTPTQWQLRLWHQW